LTAFRLHAALVLACALVVVAATIVLLVAQAAAREPSCAGKAHCGGPPLPELATIGAPPLVGGAVWRSSLGVQFEYDPSLWAASRSSSAAGDGIFLTSKGRISGLDVRVFVLAQPASATSSTTQIQAERRYLLSLYPTLALDVTRNQPLTPAIGSAFGIGEADAGTTPDEQNPLEAMLLAAGKDGVDVLVAAWTDNGNGLHGDAPFPTFLVVDQLLETFQWPSESSS
jgi:hypothetical protein